MKREVNKYLFDEFEFNTARGAEEKISAEWPFVLQLEFSHDLGGKKTNVFSFNHEGEAYYAVHGAAIDFFTRSGLDAKMFKNQLVGAHWLGLRNPVNLHTERPGDPKVPGVSDRRQRLERLARDFRPGAPFVILEGLFLEISKEHVGLIQFQGENVAHIVADRFRLRDIPYPDISNWRRLSVGIGKLIEAGILS
jgi:hypothetical protein